METIPKTVLVVAAHADDNEFCFGGTINKWAKAGSEIHYLVVTDGRRGTEGAERDPQQLIETRQKEQQAAANTLGVKSVSNLAYEDGRMEATIELKKDIVKTIRTIKPDAVMFMDPTYLYSAELNYVNHNDHRAVGQATFDAVYPLARDENAFDDLAYLPTHKTLTLLMHNPNKENFYVTIDEEIDTKIAALLCHESQFSDESRVKDFVKYFAGECAKKIGGCKYAEGFVKIQLN